MEIKILKVYELNNILRVETECPYGKDNLGLSINAKYLDPETGIPKWKFEVKKLLEEKYGLKTKKKKEVFKEDVKTFSSLDELIK